MTLHKVGQLRPGSEGLKPGLLDDHREIAVIAGYSPRPKFLEHIPAPMPTARDSTLTASMLGGMEADAWNEADHVDGDLINRQSGDSDGERTCRS
jgi:hypothetical protein